MTTIKVDGRDVPLKLSLGALAEIEEALGVQTLTALAERLASPSAGQLLLILKAMARAGGAPDPERIAAGRVCLKEIMAALALLFREILEGEAPGKASAAGRDGEAG